MKDIRRKVVISNQQLRKLKFLAIGSSLEVTGRYFVEIYSAEMMVM